LAAAIVFPPVDRQPDSPTQGLCRLEIRSGKRYHTDGYVCAVGHGKWTVDLMFFEETLQ
jgi:hypothetical protein